MSMPNITQKEERWKPSNWFLSCRNKGFMVGPCTMPARLWLSLLATRAYSEQGRYMSPCSHQLTVTGQARLLWLNLDNKPTYQLYPLRVTSHVISPLSHSASHHFHNDWDRMDTNSRYRESIYTPTGIPCISNTRISCICYTQVPQYYTRLSLQAVCWMMLATGALAFTAVFISSIYSLLYLISKCRLPS